MIRRWLALTYYLYALRLAALSHFYFIHYTCGLEMVVRPSRVVFALGFGVELRIFFAQGDGLRQ